MAYVHAADYVVFGVLLVASALVGPFFMWRHRKTRTTAESYYVGNRRMRFIPVAVSLFASFWSATALIGIPAELYTGGGRFIWNSVGQALGVFLGAFVAVPMMYRLKLINAYDYLELRFQSKLVKYIGTAAGILATIFDLAITSFAPCVALAAVSPIPVWASVIVTNAVTLCSAALGGIHAVIAVDFIQAMVLFLGILVATVVGITKIDGGFAKAIDVASTGQRLNFFDSNMDLRNTYSLYSMLLPSIIRSMYNHATTQVAVQRFSCLPTVKKAVWSVAATGPQVIVGKILILFLTLAMFAHYELLGCDPLRGKIISSPNQLTMFYVSEILAYPGLVGVWFAAVFSGALSILSSGFNSQSAVIWQGLLKDRLEAKLSARGVAVTMKLITVLLGIVSSALAIAFESIAGSVIKLTATTTQVFAGAVFLLYIAGSLFPFINATGVISGVVVSTGLNLFIAIGQMVYKTGTEEAWLPTTTTNCTSPFLDFSRNSTTLLNPLTTTAVVVDKDGLQSLSPGLIYLFSISFFLVGLLAQFCGLLVSIVVSLFTGGLTSARSVEQRVLIVKNCFYKATSNNSQRVPTEDQHSMPLNFNPDESSGSLELVPVKK